MLAPFSPHVAEELYQMIHDKGSFHSIHAQLWPTYEAKMLEKDEVTIVIQVNGRVRDSIMYQVLSIKDQGKIEERAKQSENVQKHLEGKGIKKVIYVEGKILNFVTE